MFRPFVLARIYPMLRSTIRASLSGTFRQILPELVTPLKGHSLSPRGKDVVNQCLEFVSAVLSHLVSNESCLTAKGEIYQ